MLPPILIWEMKACLVDQRSVLALCRIPLFVGYLAERLLLDLLFRAAALPSYGNIQRASLLLPLADSQPRQWDGDPGLKPPETRP